MNQSLPCIVCEKSLDNVFSEHSSTNQPSDGIACETFGHYGTTVFDPMDGSFLEFNICDDCVREKSEKHMFLIGYAEWDESGKELRKLPLKPWLGPKHYRYDVSVDV